MNQRLGIIEQPTANQRGSTFQTNKPGTSQSVSTNQACDKIQDGMESQISDEDSSQKVANSALDGLTSTIKVHPNVAWSDVAATPAWILAQGTRCNNRRKKVSEDAAVNTKPRLNHPKGKKTGGIVGTGTGGDIQVIRSKLVSVFATKFTPNLDSETLTSYMENKLGRKVTCQKLETVHSRFSSFKITAECSEMYDPELWPEGTFVRRFYEARKPKPTVGPMAVMNVPSMGAGVHDVQC